MSTVIWVPTNDQPHRCQRNLPVKDDPGTIRRCQCGKVWRCIPGRIPTTGQYIPGEVTWLEIGPIELWWRTRKGYKRV